MDITFNKIAFSLLNGLLVFFYVLKFYFPLSLVLLYVDLGILILFLIYILRKYFENKKNVKDCGYCCNKNVKKCIMISKKKKIVDT